MAARTEIIVLSPHLDDAVLDCCDHILTWKRNRLPVRVLTVFTFFSNRILSPWTRWYSQASGHQPIKEIERIRTCEDAKAMSILGVLWNHLGFIDAGFRSNEGEPLYPDMKTIFSGIVSPYDTSLLSQLRRSIISFRNCSQFLVPLGIGKHVDHILVRKAAEQAIGPGGLCYYVDYPYALSGRNWTINHVARVVTAKKSIKWMTKEKRRLLSIYSSQTPLLFGSIRFYPEIILNPKDRPTEFEL